MINPEKLEDTI